MKAFLQEIGELVADGEGDRMIEVSVSDLFLIVDELVLVMDLICREKQARMNLARAVGRILDRVESLECTVRDLEYITRDLP